MNLTEEETKLYNDLFLLCDSQGINKVEKLKATEFLRTSSCLADDEATLSQVRKDGII